MILWANDALQYANLYVQPALFWAYKFAKICIFISHVKKYFFIVVHTLS